MSRRRPAATASAERREIAKGFQRDAKKLRKSAESETTLGGQWDAEQLAQMYDTLALRISRGEF